MKTMTTTVLAAASLFLIWSGAASATTAFPVNSGTILNLTVAGNAQTFSAGTASGDGYYYTFTTQGHYNVQFTDTGSLQASVVDNPFIVTTGSVAGAGTTVATSVSGAFADGASAILNAGTYTLYVASTSVGEGLSGTVSVSAIPEPVTWSLMILGVAGVGGALRDRSRRASSVTV